MKRGGELVLRPDPLDGSMDAHVGGIDQDAVIEDLHHTVVIGLGGVVMQVGVGGRRIVQRTNPNHASRQYRAQQREALTKPVGLEKGDHGGDRNPSHRSGCQSPPDTIRMLNSHHCWSSRRSMRAVIS